MAKYIDLCEKYFGTRDFYEVLKISKTARDREVSKAYRKLSLHVHPDRADEDTKVEATEKFQVLGFIHSILSDNEKRKIYDQTGEYDEESEEVAMRNWADYWRSLFKEITTEDINTYEKNYKGSETEVNDLKRAYMDSEGDMNVILESVPFANCEDEPRIHEIIKNLIEKEEVPEYKAFTEESEKRKLRRKRKWAREAAEAERLAKKRNCKDTENKTSTDSDLALAIQKRNKDRAGQAENFFDSLIEKYAKQAEKPAKTKSTAKPKKKKTK